MRHECFERIAIGRCSGSNADSDSDSVARCVTHSDSVANRDADAVTESDRNPDSDSIAFANSDYPKLAVLTVLIIAILLAVSAAVVFLNRGQADRALPGAVLRPDGGVR